MILIPNKPSSKLPGTCSYNLLNGLIFSNNRVGIQQWFQRFRNSADYFKVICEQVVDFNSKEPQEQQFLQFRIVLCAKTCRVRVIPNSKSVAVPLSQFSAHAPSTKNWPVAHLKSMCQLASDRLAAEETKRQIMLPDTRFPAWNLGADVGCSSVANSGGSPYHGILHGSCRILDG